jgi:hypothetical protein
VNVPAISARIALGAAVVGVIACGTTGADRTPRAATARAHPILFYLHGRIVEDQGPAAVSPEYGRYEYDRIIEAFRDSGFETISEVRAPDTDPRQYADSIVAQLRRLLASGIPAGNLTVVGASKGAVIAMLVSATIREPDVRYVLLGNCNRHVQDRYTPALTGSVLSIYESTDTLGLSCAGILERSPGVSRSREIRISTGLRHGFLFRPLAEWLVPSIQWARRVD